MEKLKALYAGLVEFWDSLSPDSRRWIEATGWGALGAAVETGLDVWEHDGVFSKHSLVAAIGAGSIALKAALRQLPRKPWATQPTSPSAPPLVPPGV